MGKKSRNKKTNKKKQESQLVVVANSQEDPLSSFQAFRKFERNGLNTHLGIHRSSDLSPSVLDWLFEVTEANMRQIYEGSGWRWDRNRKMDELAHKNAWILLIKNQTKDTESGQDERVSGGGDGGGGGGMKEGFGEGVKGRVIEGVEEGVKGRVIEGVEEGVKEGVEEGVKGRVIEGVEEGVKEGVEDLVGFCHFRYDMDYGEEVLYCYEVQLVQAVRSKGLGRFVMQLLELLAFKSRMKKVVLTVLKKNVAASSFYRQLKYRQDDSCPNHPDNKGADAADVAVYDILSKDIGAKTN